MAKILYAAGTYGHISCFHIEYINALRSEGHEVLVMAKGEGADFNIPFEKKMLSLNNLKTWKKIKKIVKEENFDVILLNTTLAAFNIRMALGKKRPRVVNFVHGYMFPENPKGLKNKIFLFVEKFFRKKTDAIMVMNEADFRIANKYKLTRGEIAMTRGMGAELKATVASAEEIRASLNSKDRYAICFVGELCSAKNQELLIRILPKLKESIPNVVLWLPGAGVLENELKKLAKELSVEDSVRFPGYVNNPTDYVRAADIYISPSKKEGLPFNVLEALGATKPIIVSNVKGHFDLIDDGVTGFLFDKNSPEELIVKIKVLHSGEVFVNTDKQKETFNKYSRSEVFDETLSIMKSLMNV